MVEIYAVMGLNLWRFWKSTG